MKVPFSHMGAMRAFCTATRGMEEVQQIAGSQVSNLTFGYVCAQFLASLAERVQYC
jgi:hypothetical protein